MGYAKLQDDPSYLFTIRFKLHDGWVTIHAWESHVNHYTSHTKLDCELRQNGKAIFARGDLWCGIPAHQSVDGPNARECAASLFAMRPGDTDSEYFTHYSPEQLEWASSHGEELGAYVQFRYCDENGAVRRSA